MSNTDWDPRDPANLRDQRAAYDAMREGCPVAYSDFLGWSLFRHGDILAVVTDPKTYKSATSHRAIPNGMDPPEHTVYRQALAPFFSADELAAFESGCRETAAQAVDAIVRRDKVEAVDEFAEPFALKAQCVFLGWSPESWEDLRGWTHGNQESALSRDRAASKRVAQELAGYVSQALQVRRAAGSTTSHDLTSRLMATEVEGLPLSDEELVSILRNWIAGHGTVAAGLGILVFHLATDQDLQQRLRDEPTLIPAAVDEVLRADGPLVANRRTAVRSVQIEGRPIEEGAKLSLMWIAADRDPRVFPDPDTIRLDRDQRANFLFGAGIHDCLGAPLARLELETAVDELLARTSRIELNPDRTPIRSVYPSNGFSELPIRLGHG